MYGPKVLDQMIVICASTFYIKIALVNESIHIVCVRMLLPVTTAFMLPKFYIPYKEREYHNGLWPQKGDFTYDIKDIMGTFRWFVDVK